MPSRAVSFDSRLWRDMMLVLALSARCSVGACPKALDSRNRSGLQAPPTRGDATVERKEDAGMQKGKDPGGERFHRREEKKREYKKQLPGEDEEPLPPPVEPIHAQDRPKRNAPCPCGSGKKYKQCCGKAEA